jgi:ribosome-associated protein
MPARRVTRRGTQARRIAETRDLARSAARLALEKKAEDVVVLNLDGLPSVCDFFILASGRSEAQVRAISDRIEEGLAEQGVKPWHREGTTGRRWVLLDYVDMVVHVFHRETREFYMLERLWGDAKIEPIDE